MERSVPVRSGRAASRVRSLQDATVGQTVLQARRAQDVIAAAVSKRNAGCQVIRYGSGDRGLGGDRYSYLSGHGQSSRGAAPCRKVA